MSETATTRIPVQAAPAPSRWARLRGRVGSMSPRARWLNLGLLVLLIVAVVLAFMLIGNPSTPTVAVRTAAVVRGTVTASVTGSGNTASSVSTPVSFLVSGTVTAVDVKAGDTVTAGEVLATIDPTSAKATLRTAQAQMASAQAAYDQAASGPTAVKQQQDQLAITTAQQGVANATVAVTAAQNQLDLDTTSSASAVSNSQNKLSDDRQSTGTSVSNAQAKKQSDQRTQDISVTNAETSCSTANTTSAAASAPASAAASASMSASNKAAVSPTTTAQPSAFVEPGSSSTLHIQLAALSEPMASNSDCAAAQSARATRDATIKADDGAIATAEDAQNTTLDADQQAVTTAKQTQSATLLKDDNAITTAKQQVTTDQGQLTSAQLAAQADLHPETPDQIAQARDGVTEAQVTVDNAQLGVDETTLKSPQAGVVLAVSGKVGESSSGSGSSSTSTSGSGSGSGSSSGSAASAASSSATSAGSGFVTIANLSQLAVTANIAEADAAKIKIGQAATVTFPATNTTATGSVTQITPQSTVTNNVVLYPIQVSLDTAPPGVGVGSTASLSITAGSATDVVAVPNLTITSLGDRHTVTVQKNGIDTVVPVTIGLVGDTQTEVTSGLQPGDVLVLPSTTAATTTGTGAGAGFPRTGG